MKPAANVRSIISEFLSVYVRPDARPLDMVSLDTMMSGAETDIFVNRQHLRETANEEILGDEDIDPRIPLNVHFHGEGNSTIIPLRFLQHWSIWLVSPPVLPCQRPR